MRHLLALLMLTAVAVHAGDDSAAALHSLLDNFLAGATINDAAVHERFWADDLVYTSSAGARFGKAEIMSGLGKKKRSRRSDLRRTRRPHPGLRRHRDTHLHTGCHHRRRNIEPLLQFGRISKA